MAKTRRKKGHISLKCNFAGCDQQFTKYMQAEKTKQATKSCN